jgi:hypothetical protein
MPTQENVPTSTHLRQALKLLKGLTVAKFVNVLCRRPKVSLVLHKRKGLNACGTCSENVGSNALILVPLFEKFFHLKVSPYTISTFNLTLAIGDF